MPEKVPVPIQPISQQAELELNKLLNNLPSTGKGAINATITNDGARVDLAHRFNSHIASSAYWQKIRSGSVTWGARATVQW